MRAIYTESFLISYVAAPKEIQRATDKQIKFLLLNLRHPSLRAKKYDERGDIWQARISRHWRFYFTIANNTYKLIDVLPHPQ